MKIHIACFQLENHNFELGNARYLYYMGYHRTRSKAGILLGLKMIDEDCSRELVQVWLHEPFCAVLCATMFVQHVIFRNKVQVLGDTESQVRETVGAAMETSVEATVADSGGLSTSNSPSP
jgi:hypothetical protein